MDLLKMLDNRKFQRGERFKVLGLVNEPGFRAASKPDEFGLWLDEEAKPRTGRHRSNSLREAFGCARFSTLSESGFPTRKRARNGMAIVS